MSLTAPERETIITMNDEDDFAEDLGSPASDHHEAEEERRRDSHR